MPTEVPRFCRKLRPNRRVSAIASAVVLEREVRTVMYSEAITHVQAVCSRSLPASSSVSRNLQHPSRKLKLRLGMRHSSRRFSGAGSHTAPSGESRRQKG